MKRYLWFIILAIVMAIIEAGLMSRFWGNLSLSLLIPLVFLMAVYFKLDQALIFAFLAGFFYDLTYLERNLFMTVFFLLEVIIIHFLKKSALDFSNRLTLFAGVWILAFIRVLLETIIIRPPVFPLETIFLSLAFNIFLSSLIVSIGLLIFSRNSVKRNEVHG